MLYADRLGRDFVLLVEEDRMLLATCRSVLRLEGYDVVVSSKPEEALTFCEAEPGARVLVSGVTFADSRLSGLDLAHALYKIAGARTIFTSHHDRAALDHLKGLDKYPFLAQPLSPRPLLSAVIKAWDAPGRPHKRIA